MIIKFKRAVTLYIVYALLGSCYYLMFRLSAQTIYLTVTANFKNLKSKQLTHEKSNNNCRSKFHRSY